MPHHLTEYRPAIEWLTITNVPVSEEDPAEVATEVISLRPFAVKAYFPSSTSGNTLVFLHLPGGQSRAFSSVRRR